jgi:hypothetical protein
MTSLELTLITIGIMFILMIIIASRIVRIEKSIEKVYEVQFYLTEVSRANYEKVKELIEEGDLCKTADNEKTSEVQ